MTVHHDKHVKSQLDFIFSMSVFSIKIAVKITFDFVFVIFSLTTHALKNNDKFPVCNSHISFSEPFDG